jgi:transcriptional regulator GlxA family with amidase domain
MPADRTISFLLLPKVHLLDLSGPAQVFYEASQFGPSKYRVQFCGINKEIASEQGLVLGQVKSFNEANLGANDYLFVPGIDFKTFKAGKLNGDVKAIKGWLHEQYEKGVRIASICSGALILAEAGLLNGKKCTTHWKCIAYMKQRYPKVNVQTDQLYVYDQNIFTSAGMTSGIDMALSILEMHSGPMLPAKVAREIVVYLRRNSTDHQQTIYLDYQTHFNPAIHKIQDYIISHPDKNASLRELAAVGNISVRNLTRMFKKATGHTIVEFKNSVKIELARTLIHNPEFTTEKVAALCGFGSVRHFRRVWNEQTGTGVRTASRT